MNLDEEIFLSAYLDDALAPAQRARVESALLTDPHVSEHLRALGVVRDLVSALPRPPAPADVSTAVVARIEGCRDSGPFGLFYRVVPAGSPASRTARVAALVSAAAALVLAAVVGLLGRAPGEPGAPALVRNASDRGLVRKAPAISARPGENRPTSSPVLVSRSAPGPRDLGPGREELQDERNQQRVRRLLDSPNLRKVFFVTDVLGGDACRQVGDLLEKFPRKLATFGRLTVAQEVLLDPDHPGEATVFVVVMDDGELKSLLSLLRESFPDAVEETLSRPEVVTQLAEVGRVAVFPGTPVADLFLPHEAAERAQKSDLHAWPAMISRYFADHPGLDPLHDLDRYSAESQVTASQAEGPTPEQERSGPHPSIRGKAAPEVAPPKPQARPRPVGSVVLVWVATPVKAGRGAR